MPDEIVKQIFEIDSTYSPVTIGIERDGLEEFILQPLRHEQLKRGYSIPIRALRAPEGKIAFISGLQPYFKAGEVVFAKECKQAREQFLNFPSGRIDIPNALAYALTLRGGQPVYDNFNNAHVALELQPHPKPAFLAVNTDSRATAAAVLQLNEGALHILADRVREGEPAGCLAEIITELTMETGCSRLRLLLPPIHFNSYSVHGLRAACRSVPVEFSRGGDPAVGRQEITALLNRLAHGRPCLQVSSSARWTLNSLSGGYYREIAKSGQLTAEPAVNAYRVLMEGIESFAAVLKSARMDEDAGREAIYLFPAGPGTVTIAACLTPAPHASTGPRSRSTRRTGIAVSTRPRVTRLITFPGRSPLRMTGAGSSRARRRRRRCRR